jgi:sugar O-acyltransferase (sialic acid O-acetyltransferase NeuD family)
MTSPKYILWGGKGHALVLAEIVQQQGGEVIALFDSAPIVDTVLPGIETHIGIEAYEAWILKQESIKSISALAAIGGARGSDRREYLERFRKSGFKTPTLVHSSAVVSASANIGENSHILAGAVIAPMAELGEACIINTNASVDHECVLGAGVHIAPGATLCGCVRVGENTLIGAGSVVLPRVKIGANVVIGAGSVVTRDIPDGVVAFGNPAKIIEA